MLNKKTLFVLPAALIALAGCTSSPEPAEYDKMADAMTKSSFQDKGIAKVTRLDVDDANRECSKADVAGVNLQDSRTGLFSVDGPMKDGAGNPLGRIPAKAIEEANMKTIKWPSDGKFLGDWKQGETIAQSGRGLTWTDAANQANGGNCYNCHQISKEELSFGTLGPSLYNYGKLRGVSDPNAASSKAIVEYTWGKLWNARAYNACSQMPRVGHGGILNEAQIKHVMALLLDPQSPINK